MTTQSDEEFLAIQDEIVNLYHKGPQPEPSESVDSAIMAQAKQQLMTQSDTEANLSAQQQLDAELTHKTNVVQLKTWRKYTWQISTAASVILIVGLLLVNPMMQQQPTSTDADEIMPMQMDIAEPMQAEMAPASVAAQRLKSAKSAPQAHTNDDISIVSPQQGVEVLNELAAQQQWQQAVEYLLVLEQQFPQIKQQQHPLHQQYIEIKQTILTR
ncbi:hypothetical protein [Shewanella gaetbuli]